MNQPEAKGWDLEFLSLQAIFEIMTPALSLESFVAVLTTDDFKTLPTKDDFSIKT